MSLTLGIFKGLVGILGCSRDAFPDGHSWAYPNPESNAFFKIYTGIDHEGLTGARGDLPDARLFNEHGQFIGMVADPPEYIRPGVDRSNVFWADSSKGLPFYTLFSGNYDAQCIAFATLVWPGDLSKFRSGHFGWVGDWGSECAGDDQSIATWYYSNFKVPGSDHIPNCMWVDQDGGVPATGFQVNWVDMIPVADDPRIGQKAKDMCQTPSFHVYQHYDPQSIIYHGRKHGGQSTDGTPVLKRSEHAPPRKRTKPRRSAAEAKLAFEKQWRDKVVVDDVPSHTAHTLCEAAGSAGPSFVNPEDGYFCDMETKEIYPVCKVQKGEHVCFDLEQSELVGPGLQKRSVPYQVLDWRISRNNGTAQNLAV